MSTIQLAPSTLAYKFESPGQYGLANYVNSNYDFNILDIFKEYDLNIIQMKNDLKTELNKKHTTHVNRIKENHMNVNYNFLLKLYSELTQDQKLKFNKNLQIAQPGISKTG